MSLHNILLYIFTVVFAIGVILNTFGPQGIKDSYVRWGLPANFRFLTAAMELAALILVWTGYPWPGYLTALIVMCVAVLILLRSHEYKPIIAPGIIILLILFLI